MQPMKITYAQSEVNNSGKIHFLIGQHHPMLKRDLVDPKNVEERIKMRVKSIIVDWKDPIKRLHVLDVVWMITTVEDALMVVFHQDQKSGNRLLNKRLTQMQPQQH